MKQQFKLDDSILLALLLKKNKLSRNEYIQQVKRQYSLDSAKQVSTIRVAQTKTIPGTSEKMYTDYNIHDTGKYLVKATKYGRVVDIEQKAQSMVTQPKVIIKKKRTIQK